MSDGDAVPPVSPRGSFGGITSGAGARSASRAVALGAGGSPTEGALRAARRRWTSGVAVVTTIERDGETTRLRGATVSALTVASLEPPLVLVCLDRESGIARAIAAAEIFAVAILDRAHASQADRFAGLGPLPDGRFTGVPYEVGATGCPVLRDALAWFDCRLSAVHDGGDHVILVGAVCAVGLGEDTDDPLLTYEGGYRRIEGA